MVYQDNNQGNPNSFLCILLSVRPRREHPLPPNPTYLPPRLTHYLHCLAYYYTQYEQLLKTGSSKSRGMGVVLLQIMHTYFR